jgi:outer membrane receptor for ferrienterochelin and colicin
VEGFLRNGSNVGSANLKRIPTQYPLDAGATYHCPKNRVVLNFDVKNIFDRQIYDNYGLQKPGRAFYVKLTYNIL